MHIISAINKHFSKLFDININNNNNNINNNFVHNFYFFKPGARRRHAPGFLKITSVRMYVYVYVCVCVCVSAPEAMNN